MVHFIASDFNISIEEVLLLLANMAWKAQMIRYFTEKGTGQKSKKKTFWIEGRCFWVSTIWFVIVWPLIFNLRPLWGVSWSPPLYRKGGLNQEHPACDWKLTHSAEKLVLCNVFLMLNKWKDEHISLDSTRADMLTSFWAEYGWAAPSYGCSWGATGPADGPSG